MSKSVWIDAASLEGLNHGVWIKSAAGDRTVEMVPASSLEALKEERDKALKAFEDLPTTLVTACREIRKLKEKNERLRELLTQKIDGHSAPSLLSAAQAYYVLEYGPEYSGARAAAKHLTVISAALEKESGL